MKLKKLSDFSRLPQNQNQTILDFGTETQEHSMRHLIFGEKQIPFFKKSTWLWWRSVLQKQTENWNIKNLKLLICISKGSTFHLRKPANYPLAHTLSHTHTLTHRDRHTHTHKGDLGDYGLLLRWKRLQKANEATPHPCSGTYTLT